MRQPLLLTVTHGYKNDDREALEIAEAILSEFSGSEMAAGEVELIANTQPRSVVDMNRHESRGTPFREKIDKALYYGAGLLLDVHSFEAGSGEHDWPDSADVVLLHTEGVTDRRALTRWAIMLRDRGVDAVVYPAGRWDDVAHRAAELGQPADRIIVAEHRDGVDAAAVAKAHAFVIQFLLA